MPCAEEKRRLREQFSQLRHSISAECKALWDAALCRAVLSHPAFLQADALLSFFAVRGEVDLSPVTEAALKKGIPVGYPRCEGREMRFFAIQSLADLRPDRFGIPAPHATCPALTPGKHTLCLLPGLAAGRDGSRLGYGGGFYDRFLEGFEGVTLFPVYDLLLTDTLPLEPTDQKVLHILTEKGEIAHV